MNVVFSKTEPPLLFGDRLMTCHADFLHDSLKLAVEPLHCSRDVEGKPVPNRMFPRIIASLSMCRAMLGRSSEIRMPGMLVEIGWKPLLPFTSQVSRWLTPPSSTAGYKLAPSPVLFRQQRL